MTEQESIKFLKNMYPKKAIMIDGRYIGRLDNVECYEGQAITKAIETLEKQIPKVPCYSGDGYYNGEMVIDTWECPCCGEQYEVDYDDYEYCPNCGQHIDHSTLTEDD